MTILREITLRFSVLPSSEDSPDDLWVRSPNHTQVRRACVRAMCRSHHLPQHENVQRAESCTSKTSQPYGADLVPCSGTSHAICPMSTGRLQKRNDRPCQATCQRSSLELLVCGSQPTRLAPPVPRGRPPVSLRLSSLASTLTHGYHALRSTSSAYSVDHVNRTEISFAKPNSLIR